MKIIFNLILGTLISIISIGCEGEEGKRGLPAPLLIGSISGSVSLVNSINSSGVEIKLLETSQSTLSDSLGNWVINDVKAGIYTIVCSKSTYGTSKLLNYQFIGGGISRISTNIQLTKIPEYTANNLEIIESPKDEIGQLSCFLEFTPKAPSNEQRIFRFYFSKYKYFLPSTSNYFYTTTYSGIMDNPFSELTVRFKGIAATLKNKLSSSSLIPFSKGDTVYVVACASGTSASIPQQAGSGFYDYGNFSQYVYTDITTPTNTVSFILP
ncbi:MAG: hypothetical protein JST20_07480 [Bacteroidetes bacterium]|nr:hypothetical protein [Bacteroidota bacterium]